VKTLWTMRMRRWGCWAAAGAVAAYSLYHFRHALLAFYFFDDFWVMHDAAHVRVESVGDLRQFFRPSHVGFAMYRPLTTVWYSYVLQSLCGYDASAQHACQLLVFTANVLLAFAITQRLTGSTVAATAAGLFYTVAPGQALNAYWLSAFTVTGTAFWLLVMMACWLFATARWRAVLCALVQTVALASSEHAVAGPALLVVLAAMQRESARSALGAIAPSAILVGVYLVAKLYYFMFVRPPIALFILDTNGPSWDVTLWLEHLGQYLVQCFTPLALWAPDPTIARLFGSGLVVILALATWRAYRSQGPWVFVAGGIALFIASLSPVFPQRAQFGSPYICTAVLGAAWLVIGLCQCLGHNGRWLALAVAIAMLVIDRNSGERAWRDPRVFRLVVNGSLGAARWMETARSAARAGYDDVLIPEDAATKTVFIMGRVQTFFPEMPSRVTLYDPSKTPPHQPEQAILPSPVPLTTPYDFPGAEPRWNWLRRLVAP
jgi:hypothetical protein